MFIFPVQLTTSRIGNLARLIHTLLYVMAIHTYIHTYICDHTYITKGCCGKREAHINWSMVMPEKAAHVAGTTLRTTGPVPADSRP